VIAAGKHKLQWVHACGVAVTGQEERDTRCKWPSETRRSMKSVLSFSSKNSSRDNRATRCISSLVLIIASSRIMVVYRPFGHCGNKFSVVPPLLPCLYSA